jgi:hypothetical protein
VARAEVTAFLDRIARLAPAVPEAPPDHVPLAKAAEKTKTTSVTLLRRILDGEIAGVVRSTTEPGLAALRIPVSALPKPELPPDRPLALRAVFDRLRLSHAAGVALVGSAFGKAELPVRFEKRGRRQTGLVRQDDLDTFVRGSRPRASSAAKPACTTRPCAAASARPASPRSSRSRR